MEDDKDDETSETSANNPLCPGAVRGKNQERNPFYEHTYVFENDFPALQSDIPPMDNKSNSDDLFRCHAARGVCKVICFHPNSKLTLPRMTLDDIAHVIRTWIEVFQDLAKQYAWVQIFENRGEIMGCSSTDSPISDRFLPLSRSIDPHPHCQVWATDFLPNEGRVKHRTQKEYFDKHHGQVLLRKYLERELN